MSLILTDMNAPVIPDHQIAKDLTASLAEMLGVDAVDTDETERRFASQDLFFEGALPLAILSPRSAQEVSSIAKWCSKNGVAICPRG